MMDIEWRDIPGHADYIISNEGRVKNNSKGWEIRPSLHHTGYMCVTLSDVDGKRIHRSIHRLLALAFMGDMPSGMHVHHKNSNRLDNRLSNLEYKLASEHLREHHVENGVRRAEKAGLLKQTLILSIINAHCGSMTPAMIQDEVLSRYPGAKVSSIPMLMVRLAKKGHLKRIARGWYVAATAGDNAPIPCTKKNFVTVAAAISPEHKNIIDVMAEKSKTTISEVIRNLIEFALNDNR